MTNHTTLPILLASALLLSGCNTQQHDLKWVSASATSLAQEQRAVVNNTGGPGYKVVVYSIDDDTNVARSYSAARYEVTAGTHKIRATISELVYPFSTPMYHKAVTFDAAPGAEYTLEVVTKSSAPLIGWTDKQWWLLKVTEKSTGKVWVSDNTTLPMPLF